MITSPRSFLGLATAGAALGLVCVLAIGAYAVIDEVYVGCAPIVVEIEYVGGRCHDLGHAVSVVLWPLFAYGALAASVGGLGGLAIAAFYRLASDRRSEDGTRD